MLRREQRRLGFEVVLHREVEIEVVLTQVGEHGDVVAVAVNAMLDEGMRGDLHRHRHPAGLAGRRQLPLQVGSLRRRASARERADDRSAQARSLEDTGEQVRGRRLAGGPGDPGHPQQ